MAANEAPSPQQLFTPPGAGPVREERLHPRGRAELHAAAPSDSSVQVGPRNYVLTEAKPVEVQSLIVKRRQCSGMWLLQLLAWPGTGHAVCKLEGWGLNLSQVVAA